MATPSYARLRDALTIRLDLERPLFQLEKLPGGKIAGSVVSDTFARKDDVARQKMIWDALEAEFGVDEARGSVGALLAYTHDEWNIPLTGVNDKKRKSRTK